MTRNLVVISLLMFMFFSCKPFFQIIGDGENETEYIIPDYVVTHYIPENTSIYESYSFTVDFPPYICAFEDSNNNIEILLPTGDSFTEVGSINMDEYGNSVANMTIKDDIAFVSQYTNTFLALDLSTPENPQFISKYNEYISPFSDKNFPIVGDYAYIVDDRSTIEILDISNPDSITYVNSLDLDYGQNVIVDGNRLYALEYYNLKIFDVTSPANPVFKSTLPVGSHYAELNGNLLYLMNMWDLTLTIIDVTDSLAPTVISTFNWEEYFESDDAYGAGLIYKDGTIYLLDAYMGILSIDVSDPYSQNLSGVYPMATDYDSLNTIGNDHFTLIGDHFYVSSGTWGITVIDKNKL